MQRVYSLPKWSVLLTVWLVWHNSCLLRLWVPVRLPRLDLHWRMRWLTSLRNWVLLLCVWVLRYNICLLWYRLPGKLWHLLRHRASTNAQACHASTNAQACRIGDTKANTRYNAQACRVGDTKPNNNNKDGATARHCPVYHFQFLPQVLHWLASV